MCVVPHGLVTLLFPVTLFLYSSSQNRSSSRIPFGWCERCGARVCHIFAACVLIVLISHGDMTSVISTYSTCSRLCALASISNLGFGFGMMGKGNQGPAEQAVRPETSQTPLVQQPTIVSQQAHSSHSRI
jgi:hypothetical protein